PYSEINYRTHAGASRAYFSCVGVIGTIDGGVVECDMANPANQSVILTEANAGGDIVDVEIVSETKGFAIVFTSTSLYNLIAFNPSTGLQIGPTMYSVNGNDLRYLLDIEPSSLGLLLADFNPMGTPKGIRCFDMTTDAEIPGGPISMVLAP